MSLREYRQKRNFSHTPEPSGEKTAMQSDHLLQFVIQKHAARKLHYDFRLEISGVLKSWAIPKGPSLDPKQRRLAVQVEDHPLEYANFEGVIPKGQYGGGEVIVWDHGYWQCQGDPIKGLKVGKLKFVLIGKKLHGSWLLLRIGDANHQTHWLLMKENDEAADPSIDVTVSYPASTLSGKILKIITETQQLNTTMKKIRSKQKNNSKKNVPLLVWSQPQLATLVDKLPSGKNWVYEIKYDGFRVITQINNQHVTLYTRQHNDWTARFAPIAKALEKIQADQAILDGEIVVLDEKGVSNFQALQNVLQQNKQSELHYYIFDLLQLDQQNSIKLPLIERKKILQKLLSSSNLDTHIHFCEHIQASADEIYQIACQKHLEGIIAKRADAAYYFGRSETWLKTKCLYRQEFVIGGFTDPTGSRIAFGALLVGYYDEAKRLHYAGKVGTGFTVADLRYLYKTLALYQTDQSPFTDLPNTLTYEKITWLSPKYIAEVVFRGWTNDNRLRQPSFYGLREDKDPGEVMQEKAKHRQQSNHITSQTTLVAGASITNPNKILFSTIQLSKLDLAEYYESIAEWILPYIAHRPLSILRCPNGVDKECFFQRHLQNSKFENIKEISIHYSDKSIDTLVIEDIKGLIELIQLGVVEIHPWQIQISHTNFPDQIIFDLDPGQDITWQQMIDAAKLLKNICDDLELLSFVKTTGKKGLHVAVPIEPIYTWQTIHDFAKAMANTFVKINPHLYIAEASKSKRQNKIFIDYLRNNWGATAIAPYSTRISPTASIATPLAWKELDVKHPSDYYNLNNILKRLTKLKEDPWKEYSNTKQKFNAEILELFKTMHEK